MACYLADSSIWAWARQGARPDIAERLAARFELGEVCTCAPVVLEVMHRARTGREYEAQRERFFAPLEWVALEDRAGRRALEVQRALAGGSHGNHLRPAVDYLIAACAELADPAVTLWFFDRDLRVICEHTGQPYEAEASAGPGR